MDSDRKSGDPQTMSRHRLTVEILAGMGIGVVVGLLCSLLINRVGGPVGSLTETYAVEGVFALGGQAFLALLRVLVVPLVLVSLICGTAALDDIRKLGRIGLRTVALYLFTTATAISLALGSAVIVGPGRGFGLDTDAEFSAREAPSLIEVLINIFPKNAFAAMAEGNMLQIIVFAILVGLALTLSGAAGKRILAVFNDLNEVVMSLVWIVMKLAPYGVFALIARTFATQGFDAFAPLIKYFLLVIGVLFLHALVTYPLLLKFLTGLNPLHFLKKLRDVQIFAFSTASSNATIPISLKTVEERLGVHNSVASFTVPLTCRPCRPCRPYPGRHQRRRVGLFLPAGR
jgi:Na+/H+-dicarboxylate symporter